MARILLVEDDMGARQIMEHALFDGGYEVDAAATLEVAHDFLARHLYDLVIADLRMPDGSGIELAGKARAQGMPVLIITGYAFNAPRDDLSRYEYLLKPVRPSELLQAVGRMLDGEKI